MIIFGSPTDNADWIVGDDGHDWIYGMGGNDLLMGAGGNDLIFGNHGDDTVIPGYGIDFIYGGFLDGDSGVDTVSYGNYTGAVTVDLAQRYGYQTSLGNADKDTLNGIENAVGSSYDDNLLGDAGANKLTGNGGNDVIYGRGGNDSLYGGNGNDELGGGAGADVLDGGAGEDTITYFVSSAGVVVHLAGGFELQGDAQGDTIIGIENVQGSFYNDFLFGSAQANDLYGQEGNDTLSGFEGNDLLLGNEGDDSLIGGADNDVLVGGEGKDKMSGGTGADKFVFHGSGGGTHVDSALNASSSDVITDFSHAEGDKIDLSSIGLGGSLGGNQTDTLTFTFIGRDGFSGTAGELHYGYNNGNTVISGDIDGDDDADFRIVLTGEHQLTASDFIL